VSPADEVHVAGGQRIGLPDDTGLGEPRVLGEPRPLGPLVRVIARGLLDRRRSAAVAFLAAAPVLAALILALADEPPNPERLALAVFGTLGLGLVIPLVALLLGTAALGTMIDDGTIGYLLMKPVRRHTIAAAALLVAAVASAGLTAPAVLISGLLIAGPEGVEVAAGTLLGGLLAAVVYAAVFVALPLVTGRALVVGLGYVLVWEGFITTFLDGTRNLSVREYAVAVVEGITGIVWRVRVGEGVDPPVAVALAAVTVAVAFVVATWRLTRFEVREPG
jgi:ABC-2 type transport system permease protein